MFALYHSSGFYQAPVTKSLVGGVVLASVALNVPLQSYQSYFSFSYHTIFHQFQINELFHFLASRCIFLDPKDLMCACILLYHFRIFERRYGSRKFASRFLAGYLLSALIELLVMYLLDHANFMIEDMPSGLYGPIFSLFVPYFSDIPRVAHSHVMGIPITGKSLNYIIGLQMASSSPESLLLSVIGVLVGLMIRWNAFWINSWLRIPKLMGYICHTVIGQFIESGAPSEPTTPMGATLEIQRAQQIELLEQQMAWAQLQRQPLQNLGGFNLFRNNRWQPQANGNGAAPPSDEQVRHLVEMGFNRDSVVQALRATNNNGIPLCSPEAAMIALMIAGCEKILK